MGFFMRILILIACVVSCVLTSCYKLAPEDGELSTTPTTNNPHIIQDSNRSGMFSTMR